MAQRIYYQHMTPAGYKEIEDEINQLTKTRPAKIAQLKAARALGDLSENTEYSTAKRELRHLESRLRYLNKQLKYAKVITPKDDGKVDLGCTVTITFADDPDDPVKYQLVGRQEAAIENGKLAFDSPLGKALMHKQAGDTVEVAAPAGNYQVTIQTVTVD